MIDIQLLTNRLNNFFKKKQKSISFLLGAGFSAPMGYPIGSQLNDSLINCTGNDFAFSTDGRLMVSKDGTKPNVGYKTSEDFEFDFCKDLMNHFNRQKGYFDYEEFYDYFNYEAKEDRSLIAVYNPAKYSTERDLDGMLYAIKKIYVQLVNHFLVDKDGNSYYDNAGNMGGPTWPGYTGILNCFQELKDDNFLNVHTLNHDLFFERLNSSDWMNGEIHDGFQEAGSAFFGELIAKNGRAYKVRLQRFTELYNKKISLYKLHGSKDYGLYYKQNGNFREPNQYIKTRYGIGVGNLFKELNYIIPHYDNCWINYHADFLTGTTSKIGRYAEPLLFKKLFKYFRTNLNQASRLIIIGYGGRDAEINNIIRSNFDFKNKPCFIIDPYPENDIQALVDDLEANLITKHLEDVEIADIT